MTKHSLENTLKKDFIDVQGEKMKKSLKIRLTFIISLLAIISMVGIGFYVTDYAAKEYTIQVEKTLLEIAKSSAKQIKAKVDQEFALIHAFAKLPVITKSD